MVNIWFLINKHIQVVMTFVFMRNDSKLKQKRENNRLYF